MPKSRKRRQPPPVSKQPEKKMKQTVPDKPLPVTLLSGFLGSGKTTLLQHILRSQHGLRIAIIVNDIGAINVDASLIKNTHRLTRTEEKVIALQNGCICCTLRGDLLEELVRLAELEAFDYVIIESSGISEPEQVAETFDSRLAEQMETMGTLEGDGLDEDMVKLLQRLKLVGGIQKFASIDTTATVIDAFTMMHDFDTDDLLSSRRDDVTPEDERTISDLMVDQIEFANVIVLNKTDMVGVQTKERLRGIIKQLNPDAKLIEASYGKVDVKELVNTGMFDLEKAKTGYGWLQDLHAMTLREVNGKKAITPKPETEEYNVRNFIYSRTRPFHPRRLWALVYDKFILQMQFGDDGDDEDEDEDEDEEEDVKEDSASKDRQKEAATTTRVDDGSDQASDGEQESDSASNPSTRSLAQSATSTAQTIPSPIAAKATAFEDPDDDLFTPSNEVILENKRKHPVFARLFRSKGEFFLATRPHRCGEWSQAGAMLTLTGGRAWFITLPEEEYTTGNEEIDALVRHDIEKGGEFGDRRQELVFIGEKLDHKAVEALLDECLLDDKEFKKWKKIMRNKKLSDEEKREKLEEEFDDGFPDWEDEEDEDEEHDHDHSHPHPNGLRSISKHVAAQEA